MPGPAPAPTAAPRLLPPPAATETTCASHRDGHVTARGGARQRTPATVTAEAQASATGAHAGPGHADALFRCRRARWSTIPTLAYLGASRKRVNPHNLLKDGHMRAYMAVNPAHWGDADALPNMEGYGRNYVPKRRLAYIRRREQGARGYYDRSGDL